MSSIWTNHARRLKELINCNKQTQAHLYLEQLMLFPVDVQDKIIEEISHLTKCTDESISNIISHYSMMEFN